MTKPERFSDPFAAALQASLDLLGAPAVPVGIAAPLLHWPCQSSAAIHNRIVAGTLPLPPRKIGHRWYITAIDLARQLLGEDPYSSNTFGRLEGQTLEPEIPARRGPGRPRKVAPVVVEGGAA